MSAENLVQALHVGPFHRAAAPAREAVAKQKGHVDIQRAQGNALLQHLGALVDHGRRIAAHDFAHG